MINVSDMLKNLRFASACCSNNNTRTYNRDTEPQCLRLRRGQAYIRLSSGKLVKFHSINDLRDYLNDQDINV